MAIKTDKEPKSTCLYKPATQKPKLAEYSPRS